MAKQRRRLASGHPRLGRNVVSGRGNHFTGFVPSAKQGNLFRLIAYESILERDFIQLLENDEDVVAYVDRDGAFFYADENGDQKRYLPDFVVTLRSDRTVCVEVKPSAKLARPDVAMRMEAIRQAVARSKRFDAFLVVTEKEIRHVGRLYNAELMNSVRLTKSADDGHGMGRDIHLRETMMGLGKRPTVAEMREASGLGAGSFRAILDMVAHDAFRVVDPHVPIGDQTVVTWETDK